MTLLGEDMTRRISVRSIVLLAICRAIFAQGIPTAKLNLAEAEATALRNHPQVLAEQNEVAAMNQRILENRAPYYPALFGEVTGSQANPRARIGAGALAPSSLFNRIGQGISISQLITDSGRTPNLVASSRLQADAANQTLQATKYDVLLAVNQSYFNVLRSQALVRTALKTVDARKLVVDQISTLARNGLRSQLDVSLVEYNLSQAKLLLIQTQNQVQEAYASLTRALGAQQPADYELVEEPLPPSPSPVVEDLVAQAIRDRPELASLRLNSQAAYRFERAERDLALPTATFIGVGGGLPYIAQLTLPRVIPHEYEGVAVNVQIPILNGGLFRARREEAHARAQEADQRVRDSQTAIARDVRIAWANSNTAFQRLDVTAELLREATLAMSLAQGRYENNLATIVEVTLAQLNVTEAEIENLNAKYDYQSQYFTLQYTLGALR
jgi:outer membrane protein